MLTASRQENAEESDPVTELYFQYSLCLGSLHLIELITVMVSFIFRERVADALKEGIYQSMELYGKETQSNQAVDFLQSKVCLDSRLSDLFL